MPQVTASYIAIDQHGQVFYNLRHPRKDLMERLGCKHAAKMYVGDGEHVGYVIAGHWLSVYRSIWQPNEPSHTEPRKRKQRP